VRVGIIRTRWNDEYVSALVKNARTALLECNVTESNIFETQVPGAFELPLAARFLALSGTVDAIICAGVLIKGDTYHFEYISEAVSSGIMSVGLQTSTPCIFGVLTCANEEQVKARTSHGHDYGKTAVEMALLRSQALGASKAGTKKMKTLGFGADSSDSAKEKERVGFF
jgi:6,7-dimethyl-8-ribityllumazine synthase